MLQYLNIFYFLQVYTGDFVELISNKSYHSLGKMYELFPPHIKPFIPPLYNEIYKRHTMDQYKYLQNCLKVYPKYLKAANKTFQKVAKEMKITRRAYFFYVEKILAIFDSPSPLKIKS